MAAPKTGSVRDGCSKLFKTFDIALKKSERHLVLSTTYGLNSSWSKKVIVGLRLRLDGSFEPVVKFVNNYSSGVSLSTTAWEELVGRFGELDEYFVKKEERSAGVLSCLMNDTISLDGGCSMRFTSAHGAKVLAFYTSSAGAKETAEIEAGDNENEDDDAEPGGKKRKTYSPVILMQKITFDGLKHISCCVNEHLLQLEVLTADVNQCKGSLIEHFTTVAKTRKMKAPTLQQIGVLVCEEADVARELVSLQAEGNFRDHYFDIVFCELLRLFLPYIIADVRQSIMIAS